MARRSRARSCRVVNPQWLRTVAIVHDARAYVATNARRVQLRESPGYRLQFRDDFARDASLLFRDINL
ncbi:hypothetical protein GCM10027565_22910 [Bordetella tumulicola]